VHLGAVEDGAGFLVVGDLFLREREAENILGESPSATLVVALDSGLIMNTKAGMMPGKEAFD